MPMIRSEPPLTLDGARVLYYCSLGMPVQPTGQHTIHREDGSVYTKDQEVFDWAAQRYPVVEQSRQKSFEVLDWLEQHAKKWTGPFSTLPQRLSRTDFATMKAEEIQAVLQS